MEQIPVCVRYKVNGEETDRFPFPAALAEAEPVIEYLPGWKTDISDVRSWEDLPQAAKDYVEYIERSTDCHIKYVSVGPQREQYFVR